MFPQTGYGWSTLELQTLRETEGHPALTLSTCCDSGPYGPNCSRRALPTGPRTAAPLTLRCRNTASARASVRTRTHTSEATHGAWAKFGPGTMVERVPSRPLMCTCSNAE